jgi:hypothetical protein
MPSYSPANAILVSGREAASFDQHQLHAGSDLRVDRFRERQELGVDENDIVFGVIDRIENLLRGDAHVNRMQDRAHHRHRKEAFEVAVAVPVHDRNGGPGLDAERR